MSDYTFTTPNGDTTPKDPASDDAGVHTGQPSPDLRSGPVGRNPWQPPSGYGRAAEEKLEAHHFHRGTTDQATVSSQVPKSSGTVSDPRIPEPRGTRRLIVLGAVGALVAAGITGGAVGSAITANRQPTSVVSTAFPTTSTPSKQPSVVNASVTSTGSVSDVSDLIERVLPSVVDISVTLPRGSATGSGFVISSDGRIVTNAHVVADATKITVRFSDNTAVPATVLGVDRTDDLAVIHVDRNGLAALPLGSSSELRMGDPVVAIGSALALTGGPTATEGIVSALGRSIDTADGEHLAHLIQTDAAINPGNSGGPLLTLDGKVVGINSAGSTDAQNIGFAIAIDTAKPIVGQLANGQPVSVGFLGVSTLELNAVVAQQYGIDIDHGMLVAEVTAGSAADQAGLQQGDVIVKANGTTTDTGAVFADTIHAVGAGKTLTMQVHRNGRDITVNAVLSSHLA